MPLAFGSGRNAAVTAGSSGDQELNYRIERSLRFNSADSAYLNRTPASAGNRKTWTWSGWVKRGAIGTAQTLFSCGTAANNTGQMTIAFLQGANLDSLRIHGYSVNFRVTTMQFRDPSAWYHIVVAIDSTNVTASDRIKFYVNGSEITSFITSTDLALNTDYGINQALQHGIGRYEDGASSFLNGYLTEVNFIDGQALTPASFGETDAITGRWKAKAYSGTYGTNGFYLPFSNNSSTTTQNLLTYSEDFANAAWINYESTDTSNASTAPNGTTTADKLIPNVGSAGGQFYRTYTATDNTTYTFSTYAKPDGFSRVRLYIQKKATSATYAYADYDLSTGTIETTFGSPSATTITSVGNGWYRISISTDVGTGGTSTPTVNIQHLGTTGNGSNGLLIWGAQLEANGTVGPYLYTGASTISSSLRVAQDMSISTGGYNSWVTNNLSVTAGVGNDSLVDSPTNYGTDTGAGGEVRGNYATLNPIDKFSAVALSNGNLDISNATTWRGARGTIGMSYGKWYWEFTKNSTYTIIGIGNSNDTHLSGFIGQSVAGSYGYSYTGTKYTLGANNVSYGSSYADGDVIGNAFDADNGTLEFFKNGISQGTAYTSIPQGTYFPLITLFGGGSSSLNFGQRPFAYTAPAGFRSLCTTNLLTPTIKKPSKYMDVVTYTGNGTYPRTISGLGFQPDLVWIKARPTTYSHVLYDSVRGTGTGANLSSNETGAEGANSSYANLTAFTSDGFTVGSTSLTNVLNNNTTTFVAWAWDETPIAGMDIVSYTGNGVSNTVSHNLGVAPAMAIVKSRSGARGWYVYHKSVGTSASDSQYYYLSLNGTAARTYSASNWIGVFNSAISVGLYTDVVANGENYIAYLFAEVEGFSKFGSYTGNGSADGPFVWCGFRPRWVMIKNATTGGAGYIWEVWDSARDSANVAEKVIAPNANTVETIYNPSDIIDMTSGGFKVRCSNASANASGNTIIFAAFAESPFKYARAR